MRREYQAVEVKRSHNCYPQRKQFYYGNVK